LPVSPTVQIAVLPATTPDNATDFLTLGAVLAAGASDIASPYIFCINSMRLPND
jgi:hypothetical protein